MTGHIIFNRAHVRLKKQKSLSRFSDASFLHQWAAQNITDRLSDIKREFPLTIGIGNRAPDSFWNYLKKSGKISDIITSDFADGHIIADTEFLPFRDKSADMVISMLELHNTNDLVGCLIQIRRILKPDGVFIGCMFGGETLHELRNSLIQAEMAVSGGASPRVFPFADKQQMGALMQRAGFALPVVDSEILNVEYSDMAYLLDDLRAMGETNILNDRRKTLTSPKIFKHASAHYNNNYKNSDGKLDASFEIIFMIGWAPHESQQKPMKPGTATHKLADILETQEIGTGDFVK